MYPAKKALQPKIQSKKTPGKMWGGGGKNDAEIMTRSLAKSIRVINSSSEVGEGSNSHTTTRSNGSTANESNGLVISGEASSGPTNFGLELSDDGTLIIKTANDLIKDINDIRDIEISDGQKYLIKNMSPDDYTEFWKNFDDYATKYGAFNMAYYCATGKPVDQHTLDYSNSLDGGSPNMVDGMKYLKNPNQ